MRFVQGVMHSRTKRQLLGDRLAPDQALCEWLMQTSDTPMGGPSGSDLRRMLHRVSV